MSELMDILLSPEESPEKKTEIVSAKVENSNEIENETKTIECEKWVKKIVDNIESEAIQNVLEKTNCSNEVRNKDIDFIENLEKIDEEKIDKEEIDGDKIHEKLETNEENFSIAESKSFSYHWNSTPKLLCSAIRDYVPTETNENFTKGCQWSPDGTCLLVPSEDFRIRIYELPRQLYDGKIPDELPVENFSAALAVKEGGLIYDSCWYPLMNSWDPVTCCFLSTSRESPLHLWDAFTGELRATYRPYNQVDEVEAAISVQFIDNGREVWCGFKNALRSFDTDRPGRQKDTISFKKDFPNVTGLVSCIRENPVVPGLIAFGTYSKCIGLYKDGPLCSFKTESGVTQIEFSPCGMKLYSANRRSNDFICWDLRNPGVVLYSMKNRQSNTNQRIQFAISNDGSDIVSGGTDGFVSVWQMAENTNEDEDLVPMARIKLSNDCINGVSIHKSLPILATSSGQRLCDEEINNRDNSVRLWFF